MADKQPITPDLVAQLIKGVVRTKGKFTNPQEIPFKLLEQLLQQGDPQSSQQILQSLQDYLDALGPVKPGTDAARIKKGLEATIKKIKESRLLPPVAERGKKVASGPARVIPVQPSGRKGLPAGGTGALAARIAEQVYARRVPYEAAEEAVGDMAGAIGANVAGGGPVSAGPGLPQEGTTGMNVSPGVFRKAEPIPVGPATAGAAAVDTGATATAANKKGTLLRKGKRMLTRHGPGILGWLAAYALLDSILKGRKEELGRDLQQREIENMMKMNYAQGAYREQMAPLVMQRAMGADALLAQMLARGEERIGR